MNEVHICPVCKAEYQELPEKCNRCGFPFNASELEKSHYIAHQILKEGNISDTKDNIMQSRIILLFIAVLNIVFPFITYYNSPNATVVIGFSVIIGLIFLVFAFTAKKIPFLSLLIPLVMLIIIYSIEFIIDPYLLLNGISWKLVYIIFLSYSLYRNHKSNKIKKESEYLSKKDYK